MPHSIAVGIDFGTHASGFAMFGINSFGSLSSAGTRVQLHEAWPGQPTPDCKTRTCLLYKGSSVVSRGVT
jgi:hypothetical protein